MLTLTRTSCWALPRGLTHTVIGNPVVPGYRLAISNRSSEVSLIAASPASPLYSTKPWGSPPGGGSSRPEAWSDAAADAAAPVNFLPLRRARLTHGGPRRRATYPQLLHHSNGHD